MENMEIQPEDKIYKTYSQNYSLKPIKQEVSKLDDDLYCINCLNEVEHDTSDVFYCKSCGSWWEEKELMDFNGVFEDTKYDNELPF